MAKNKSYTGGRRAVGTPTLSKEAYFQLIRKIRNATPPKADGKSGKAYETNELYHTRKEKSNG